VPGALACRPVGVGERLDVREVGQLLRLLAGTLADDEGLAGTEQSMA
jgi:hypothetical protein